VASGGIPVKREPFLPVASPVRKKTIIGIPVQHDSRRSAERIVALRFDLLESTEHHYSGRYYGLDDHNADALCEAICALDELSAKWRTR
jgi:hypothetical protein